MTRALVRERGLGHTRRYDRSVVNVKDAVRRVLYPAYESRVVKFLPHDQIPKHVGVMLDGNRRWAKAVGLDTAEGYQAGADNIRPLLGWCEEVGVEVVTRWLLSSDNLTNRPREELADLIDVEHIAEHLYTKGQPDPDLVIRTSGEQRLGGFLLWQSANSEFYFCEALWPDFRRVDFLRAIRAYAARERRFGG